MAKDYKVLKIDELTRINDTSGVEHYYRHQIKTTGGVVLTVNVDQEDFTAEKAGPMLVKAAQAADKILAL